MCTPQIASTIFSSVQCKWWIYNVFNTQFNEFSIKHHIKAKGCTRKSQRGRKGVILFPTLCFGNSVPILLLWCLQARFPILESVTAQIEGRVKGSNYKTKGSQWLRRTESTTSQVTNNFPSFLRKVVKNFFFLLFLPLLFHDFLPRCPSELSFLSIALLWFVLPFPFLSSFTSYVPCSTLS